MFGKKKEAEVPPMPARIGRYEILEKIGSGGFGSVYRARDSSDGREVAIKTCDIRDPDSRARALREARLSSRLNHPNVVGVIDVVEEEEQPYLVQEFLPGTDLNLRMTDEDPLSLEEKLRILTGVAAGLAHAHAEGIIHRDIKPGNVRVLPDGSVKIMDFGIAKLQDGTTDITKTGITMGSASYMCPEQVSGDPMDARGDIFSWGSLAYELLSGRRAFRSENLFRRLEMVVKEEPDPLSDVAPEVPSRIVEIVQQAMRKKASDRFASAAELRDALEAASRGLDGGEQPVVRSAAGLEESTQRVVRTILLVEDDEALAAGLRETLAERGYGVETAADGREALDRLAQGDPPAMILLDLMMPRMDGWQFLQEWRSAPDRPRIPIVLLSGVGAIPDAPGVADFLRKPVSPARLLACVERYCR